ncbi:uncharacterized protein [Dermacentor albipictus]|uniref:uncharacterized protein isoform X3 n=1 Tax=Dermacentor albipictus TaxID=60249 RepID=UPI0031FE3790
MLNADQQGILWQSCRRKWMNMQLEVPCAFMSDSARAEKDALRDVSPSARQLLCHFHVLQAEWRWLKSAYNSIGKAERRQLMAAFQKDHTKECAAFNEAYQRAHGLGECIPQYAAVIKSITEDLLKLNTSSAVFAYMLRQKAMGRAIRHGKKIRYNQQAWQGADLAYREVRDAFLPADQEQLEKGKQNVDMCSAKVCGMMYLGPNAIKNSNFMETSQLTH